MKKLKGNQSLREVLSHIVGTIDGKYLFVLIGINIIFCLFPSIPGDLLGPLISGGTEEPGRLVYALMIPLLFITYIWMRISAKSKSDVVLCMLVLTITALLPFYKFL